MFGPQRLTIVGGGRVPGSWWCSRRTSATTTSTGRCTMAGQPPGCRPSGAWPAPPPPSVSAQRLPRFGPTLHVWDSFRPCGSLYPNGLVNVAGWSAAAHADGCGEGHIIMMPNNQSWAAPPYYGPKTYLPPSPLLCATGLPRAPHCRRPVLSLADGVRVLLAASGLSGGGSNRRAEAVTRRHSPQPDGLWVHRHRHWPGPQPTINIAASPSRCC